MRINIMGNKDLGGKDSNAIGKSPRGGPLKNFFEMFKESKLSEGWSIGTMNSLFSDVSKLDNWMLEKGLGDISRLGPKRLGAFQVWLSRVHGKAPGYPKTKLSLGSKQRVIANLRSFLSWCHHAGHTVSDLSGYLVLPKLPRPLPKDVPTLKEIATVIRTQRKKKSPEGMRNAALVSVLFACGLRRGEASRLKLEDIDLSERHVRVLKSKNGKGRTTVIAPWAVNVLQEYLDHGRPLLETSDSSGRVFLKLRGHPVRPKDINDVFPLICEESSLERPVTPHALRHAFCLYLLKGGASPKVVSALAGHKINMTARYTQLTDKDLEKVIRKSHPRGKRK
jgi:integrase/recombinase XerD